MSYPTVWKCLEVRHNFENSTDVLSCSDALIMTTMNRKDFITDDDMKLAIHKVNLLISKSKETYVIVNIDDLANEDNDDIKKQLKEYVIDKFKFYKYEVIDNDTSIMIFWGYSMFDDQKIECKKNQYMNGTCGNGNDCNFCKRSYEYVKAMHNKFISQKKESDVNNG